MERDPSPAIFPPIEIRWTEAMMRDVVHRWWLRAAGGWTFALASFGIAGTAYALAHGDRSWIVGVFGTLSVVVLGLSWALRRAHMKQAVERVRQLDRGRAQLTITADGLVFEVAQGAHRIAWDELSELCMHRGYWLLMRAPNDWSTLPTAALDAAQLDYVAAHFRNAGVAIRSSS